MHFISSDSEAAFSLSGYLFRKQQTSLRSKSIRQSMILKYRLLLDKLMKQIEIKKVRYWSCINSFSSFSKETQYEDFERTLAKCRTLKF